MKEKFISVKVSLGTRIFFWCVALYLIVMAIWVAMSSSYNGLAWIVVVALGLSGVFFVVLPLIPRKYRGMDC